MELWTSGSFRAVSVESHKVFVSPFSPRQAAKVVIEGVGVMGTLMANNQGVFVRILTYFSSRKFVVYKFKQGGVLGVEVFGSVMLGSEVN